MVFRSLATVILSSLISNVIALTLAPITNPADITGDENSVKREASFIGELDLRDFETFLWGSGQ